MTTQHFEKLTKRNAQAFFDLYVGRRDEVLANFFERMEAQGGPARASMDFSPESLVPLWTWMRPRLRGAEAHPDPATVPFWYEVQVRNNPFDNVPVSAETAHWVDGLAYYFAEVLLRNLQGLQWTLFQDTKAPIWNNKPILAGSAYIFPLRAMFISTLQVLAGKVTNRDSSLKDLFEIFRNDVKKFYEAQSTQKEIKT